MGKIVLVWLAAIGVVGCFPGNGNATPDTFVGEDAPRAAENIRRIFLDERAEKLRERILVLWREFNDSGMGLPIVGKVSVKAVLTKARRLLNSAPLTKENVDQAAVQIDQARHIFDIEKEARRKPSSSDENGGSQNRPLDPRYELP
ncbi:MAG: hypothetical protein HY921_03530 [Elusimicrobia bacterium]|nr:hypothetical protein [Elusimicrobiota bacterium]